MLRSTTAFLESYNIWLPWPRYPQGGRVRAGLECRADVPFRDDLQLRGLLIVGPNKHVFFPLAFTVPGVQDSVLLCFPTSCYFSS